jgi:glutamate N-acetyltransferase/amino-acid N-acetyltransferase
MIVQGFQASAVAAGIKNEGELDLGLIVSEKEAVASALFTTNQVKAAPVILSQESVRNGKVRAIIANSGNANACTGEAGLRGARITTQRVATGIHSPVNLPDCKGRDSSRPIASGSQ